MTTTLTHIDTCLSCFLTDHHNRDGEALFGVYVDGATSRAEVLANLLHEMLATGDRVADHISYDDMKACAKSLFADAYGTSQEALGLPFDSSIDLPTEDDCDLGLDESCQAWFLLTWEEPA